MLIVSILLVNTLVVFWWNAEGNTTLMPQKKNTGITLVMLFFHLIIRVLPVEFHFVYIGQLKWKKTQDFLWYTAIFPLDYQSISPSIHLTT